MTAIAVLGPGGVGGFLAGALTRTGEEVTVVARAPTAELIARQGIEVQSARLGNFHARPAAAAALREPVELLFLATKATGLEGALERIQEPPGLIVPLLNGLDHLPLLRRRFGAGRVAAGTIRIESHRPGPGRVVQTSPFLRVDLAADDQALTAVLERAAAVLRKAEVPAQVGAGEAQILWSKLVRVNALACTTSASDRELGFIRTDPQWRAALIGCIHEAASIAAAEGASIDPAEPLAELEQAHAELGSSMQRDVAAGREPELDAIAGSVLRAGGRHGIACPTITRLAVRVAERAAIEPPRW